MRLGAGTGEARGSGLYFTLKVCPLCHTKFEDDAQFCPKCKAELQDLEEVKKAEAGGIPKSFWVSVVWVCGFILVMYLIYLALYGRLDLSAVTGS